MCTIQRVHLRYIIIIREGVEITQLGSGVTEKLGLHIVCKKTMVYNVQHNYLEQFRTHALVANSVT